MSSAPLFSIVMPSFNSAGTIRESIESIQSQTLASWELIVVDDRSSDATLAIVGEMADRDPRIRVIAQAANQGPAVARNAGIAASQGRYVSFLDSDDLWLPIKLERQLATFRELEPVVCFGSYYKMTEDGVRGKTIIRAPRSVTYHELLKTSPIGCLTAAFDTHRAGKAMMPLLGAGTDGAHGRRGRGRIGHEDYAFWLQLLRTASAAHAPIAVGIEEPIAVYRVRGGSLSANKLNAAKFQWTIYREQERLPFPQAGYYFAHYAFHGLVKFLKH